jgi:NAD-dependent SIR2 family protein deacetylase
VKGLEDALSDATRSDAGAKARIGFLEASPVSPIVRVLYEFSSSLSVHQQERLVVVQGELKESSTSLASELAKSNSLQRSLDTTEQSRQNDQKNNSQIVDNLKTSISTLEEELRSSSRARLHLEEKVCFCVNTSLHVAPDL